MTHMGANKLSKASSLGVVAWPLVVGAFVLASCGADTAGGATASTINLDATNYIVKDPVTTTIAPPEDESGTSSTSQTYVVQSGDYPLGVAEAFGISLDDLLAFNGWASGSEFPFPGQEVKIPPNANSQPAQDPVADEVAPPVGDTIPAPGSTCQPGC